MVHVLLRCSFIRLLVKVIRLTQNAAAEVSEGAVNRGPISPVYLLPMNFKIQYTILHILYKDLKGLTRSMSLFTPHECPAVKMLTGLFYLVLFRLGGGALSF